MKKLNLGTSVVFIAIVLFGCSRNKEFDKGFSVGPESELADQAEKDGFSQDSMNFRTRPGSVLLTGISTYRLTTVYKMNYDKKEKSYFTGTDNYYENYTELCEGNQWNNNFMPALQAVYGFNLVNVSHYNISTKAQKYFFDKPVLIKTLYYPSFTSDTLNFQPIQRNYFMISVYDDDSNKDGWINPKDLRHFYYFDMEANHKTPLIPGNYSVISSEYDSGNDFMYVFAQIDQNNNGQRDEIEEIHVFWIDLKNPLNHGIQFKN